MVAVGTVFLCSGYLFDIRFAVVAGTAVTNVLTSFVVENGTAITVAGEPGTITIDARDSCKYPKRGGEGYDWYVELRHLKTGFSVFGGGGGGGEDVTIVDKGTGETKITWIPKLIGDYGVSNLFAGHNNMGLSVIDAFVISTVQVYGDIAGDSLTGVPANGILLRTVEVRSPLGSNV